MVLALSIQSGPVFGSMLAFGWTRGMGTAWTGTLIAPGLAVSFGSVILMVVFKYWNQKIVLAAQYADMGLGA